MKKVVVLLIVLLIPLPFLSAQKRVDSVRLNVMTFNIRMNNHSDSLNWWGNRKDFAANVIKFYDIDIFGAQEVLPDQRADLLERLPGFVAIGVSREDGKNKGEATPIFYKTKRFTSVKSGNFWLAQNKDSVGMLGWDAACVRVATWSIFKDNNTGKEFFFLNTHLDHKGQIARHEGALLILDQVTKLAEKLPIIVTGDFNAIPTDDPIKIIVNPADKRHLTHTRTVAPLCYGPNWTFHDFGRLPFDLRSWIDYIFVKGDIEVLRHGVLTESLGNLYPSDHCPVLSTIIVK